MKSKENIDAQKQERMEMMEERLRGRLKWKGKNNIRRFNIQLINLGKKKIPPLKSTGYIFTGHISATMDNIDTSQSYSLWSRKFWIHIIKLYLFRISLYP